MVAARSWQAHARAAAKPGVAEPERKALAKVGVPVLLSVDVAKPYLPVGVGSTIWHERASNRVRVGYLAAGRRVTKSISIDAVGLEKAIISACSKHGLFMKRLLGIHSHGISVSRC